MSKNNKLLEIVNQKIKETWRLFFCLSFLILYDDFDFDADKLEKFVDLLKIQIDCYKEKYFDLNDLCDVVKEETGIDIKGMV